MTNVDPVMGPILQHNILSRSRNPENDTLFSGTSPYRKIHGYPPGGLFYPFQDMGRFSSEVSGPVYTMLFSFHILFGFISHWPRVYTIPFFIPFLLFTQERTNPIRLIPSSRSDENALTMVLNESKSCKRLNPVSTQYGASYAPLGASNSSWVLRNDHMT